MYDGGVFVFFVFNDKIVVDGVESVFDYDFLVRLGGECYVVGMKREGLVVVKDKVGCDVKGNFLIVMDSI